MSISQSDSGPVDENTAIIETIREQIESNPVLLYMKGG